MNPCKREEPAPSQRENLALDIMHGALGLLSVAEADRVLRWAVEMHGIEALEPARFLPVPWAKPIEHEG